MPARLAAILAIASMVACGTTTTATPATPPSAATVTDLTPYFGSYATDDGDVVVIARMGWFFDMRTADYRTIYATGSSDHFTIGRTFEGALPEFAGLVFGQGRLTITEAGRTRTGRRVDYTRTDVTIPAANAQLAATITEPLTRGPHPAIVIVHGSERGQRHIYDVWVGIYARTGITVLTYDKRGIGESTGTNPGEYPSEAALITYADDAAAARDFLSRRPGVDPRRVGFHGGSQGGWTLPLAMQRHPGAAFAVLVSAPATTVDQTDLWASLSGSDERSPSEATMAAVRSMHSGYDPAPALRAMAAPALWLLGTNDRTVPTAVCIEIIDSLHKPNFTVQQLPTGHALLVNPTGLAADDARSSRLAPQLVPTMRTWLAKVLAL